MERQGKDGQEVHEEDVEAHLGYVRDLAEYRCMHSVHRAGIMSVGGSELRRKRRASHGENGSLVGRLWVQRTPTSSA